MGRCLQIRALLQGSSHCLFQVVHPSPLNQTRFDHRPFRQILLRAAGIPCAPINTVPEAFNLPQAAAREMVLEAEHPTAGHVKLAGFPYKFSETPAVVRRPPPLLGQHTDEILVELD